MLVHIQGTETKSFLPLLLLPLPSQSSMPRHTMIRSLTIPPCSQERCGSKNCSHVPIRLAFGTNWVCTNMCSFIWNVPSRRKVASDDQNMCPLRNKSQYSCTMQCLVEQCAPLGRDFSVVMIHCPSKHYMFSLDTVCTRHTLYLILVGASTVSLM